MSYNKYVFSLFALFTTFSWASTWVPHLTAPNGEFESAFYLINTSSTTLRTTIYPYASDGSPLASRVEQLSPQEVKRFEPTVFFAGQTVSHFRYEDFGSIRAMVIYRAKSGAQLFAHWEPQSLASLTKRIIPTARPELWDAFAYVNTSLNHAQIRIEHRDQDGALKEVVTNLPSLPPYAKQLYVLTDHFTIEEGDYFLISADQPYAIAALRGTQPGADPATMFQTANTAPLRTELAGTVAHVTPNSSEFKTELWIKNDTDEQQIVRLTPYDQNGNPITPLDIQLAPQEEKVLDPLASRDNISHFHYRAEGAIALYFGYQRRDGDGVKAWVRPQIPTNEYLIFNAEPAINWDGFAMVNTGDTTTSLQMDYYGPDHQLRNRENIANLEPNQKQLLLPEQLFPLQAGGYFRLKADQPIAMLALRGTRDSKVMFVNPALGNESPVFSATNITSAIDNAAFRIEGSNENSVILRAENSDDLPESGSILVGDEDHPILRRITDIESNGDGTFTLNTEQAELPDIIERGSLTIPYSISEANLQEKITRQLVFSSTASLQIGASTSVDVNMKPVLRVDYDEGIQEVELKAVGTLDIDLSANFQGNISNEVSLDLDLFERDLGRTVVYVKFLPVWVDWNLDIDATATLTGTADFQAVWNTGVNFQAELGLFNDFANDTGWQTINKLSQTFTPVERVFNVDSDLIARLVITPRLTGVIYSLAGPTITMPGYAEASLDFIEGTYQVGFGLSATAGVLANIPLYGTIGPYDAVVFDKFWPLAEGELPGTGMVQGFVRDAVTDQPIEGVQVTVFDVTDNTALAPLLTDADGAYQSILQAGNLYDFTFTRTNYLQETVRNVMVERDETLFLETLLQVSEDFAGEGAIAGAVIDASTGLGIADATIVFRQGVNNMTGNIVAQTTTNSSGGYTQTGLPAGNYTGEASATGFNNGFFTATSIGNTTTPNQDVTLNPDVPDGVTRIVLTWGQTPSDLDSYLTGATNSNTRFVTFFGGRTYQDSSTEVFLDVDDVSSFGPETTTIVQQNGGIYRFYVHDYTNRNSNTSSQLANSGAKVEVYRGNTLVRTFNVPANRGGVLWHVFNLQGNQITPINNIGFDIELQKNAPLDLSNLPEKTDP